MECATLANAALTAATAAKRWATEQQEARVCTAREVRAFAHARAFADCSDANLPHARARALNAPAVKVAPTATATTTMNMRCCISHH